MKDIKEFENKIINGDCLEVMREIPNDSIDLMVCSPPYFNLREYAQWKTYEDYFVSVDLWFKEMSRILKTGRYLFWNIQNGYPVRLFDKDAERKQLPMSSDTVQLAMKYFNYEACIIWNKGLAGATQRMFGSYPYPPTLMFSWLHEDILVFRKSGKAIYERKEDSKITQDEWVKLTNTIWNFQPETHNEHTAPFPIELPLRAIKGWSFTSDIILDPFLGSGTTALAAKMLNRKYVGIELSEDYCKMSDSKLRGFNPMF